MQNEKKNVWEARLICAKTPVVCKSNGPPFGTRPGYFAYGRGLLHTTTDEPEAQGLASTAAVPFVSRMCKPNPRLQ